MKLSIAMLTVQRPTVQYVTSTLNQLIADNHHVTVYVGNPKGAYLDELKNNPCVKLCVPTAEEFAGCSKQTLRYRSVWNICRAWAKIDEHATHHLVLEDDLRFSRGWYGHLDKSIKAIERITSKYLLSLYVPSESENGNIDFSFPGDAMSVGKPFAEYPAVLFYGTQAVLAPADVAEELHRYCVAKFPTTKLAMDRMLKHFSLDRKYPIFCTAPVIVQHVGEKSTGLAGKTHKAKYFLDVVKAI